MWNVKKIDIKGFQRTKFYFQLPNKMSIEFCESIFLFGNNFILACMHILRSKYYILTFGTFGTFWYFRRSAPPTPLCARLVTWLQWPRPAPPLCCTWLSAPARPSPSLAPSLRQTPGPGTLGTSSPARSWSPTSVRRDLAQERKMNWERRHYM